MINTDRLKTQFQAAGQGEVVRAFGEIAAASRASSMAVSGSSARMASALGSVVGSLVVLGAGVAAATAAIGVASVKAAAPIENLQMRFKFAFGDMADAAMASSEQIAKSLRRDVEEVQALVLTAKNLEVPNVGRAVSAAYNVSARSVPGADIEKTAAGLVYLFGKIQQLDKISGREIRQMLKAQIPIGSMMEAIKAMGLEGGKEMTGREALPKLIEVLEKYGGDAAAQQGRTMEGLTRQMKDKIGDIKEAIGLKLLPVVSKIANVLMPLLDNSAWVAGMMANVFDVIRGVGTVLHFIGKTLAVGFTAIVGGFIGLQKALTSTFTWLGGQLHYGIGVLIEKLTGWTGLKNAGAGMIDAGNRGEAEARRLLSIKTYTNQWNDLGKTFDEMFGDPMRDISKALRSVKNSASAGVGGVDPLANAAAGSSGNAGKALADNVTKAVQRYIIGGGSQAGQWMRMLDVGGRAAGTATVPIKLTPESADLQARANAAVGTDILASILRNPAGLRALKQALSTAQ